MCTDSYIAANRVVEFHDKPETYIDARMTCVKNSGDLPRIDNHQFLNDIVHNVTTILEATAGNSTYGILHFNYGIYADTILSKLSQTQ